MGSSPSRAILAVSSDVYHVFLHTGCNFPQADTVKKWDEGTIKITINPGANEDEDPNAEVCESEVFEINDKFSMDREGTVDAEFWVSQEKRVGEPKLLKIEIDGSCCKKDPLYIREVTVVWNDEAYRFPIHNYLSPYTPSCGCCCGDNEEAPQKGCAPYFYVRPGNGTLKHLETEDFILKAREKDHNNIRSMVQWENPDNVGPISNYIAVAKYDDLPRFLQFRQAQLDAFLDAKDSGLAKLKCPVIINLLGNCCGAPPQRNFKSLMDYADSFTEMGEKVGWKKADIKDGLKVGQIFDQDPEFARQIIQGPNSTKLRRVDEISEIWKNAIDMLGKDMPRNYAIDGEDLPAVIKDGRLFEILNSETLEGIGHGGAMSKLITGTEQTWYVVQTDCLLFQSNQRPEEQSLVPVLIRLENKNDGEEQTFWYPPEEGTMKTDPNYLSWLLAKMHFRCADWGIYSIGTHYARAHAQNEVFAMSMYRNLPSVHPLFRLLQPHFQGIIGINVQAREALIAPDQNAFAKFMSSGDKLPDLLVNCCKELDYENMVVPKDFETRGLKELPKNFFFRDDSEALWDILMKYITEMVNLSYPSDDDVTKDEELQKFVEEIKDPGFVGFGGGGFPESIPTKEKLVEYLTVLIFNVSCFHTGVNFQINKYLGYLPNAPASLRMPPPAQNDVVTLERIMDSLPQYEAALAIMVITEVLGNFSPIERFYVATKAENRQGYLGENMAVSADQEACIKRMVKDMEDLRDVITERNVGKFLAYNVLSPDNIPITTQT